MSISLKDTEKDLSSHKNIQSIFSDIKFECLA